MILSAVTAKKRGCQSDSPHSFEILSPSESFSLSDFGGTLPKVISFSIKDSFDGGFPSAFASSKFGMANRNQGKSGLD